MPMWTEFLYLLDTYPLLHILWLAVAASWVGAVLTLIGRLARARPVARGDRIGRRLLGALRDTTQQGRIWRRPAAGIMHHALMAGALLLLSAFVVTHYVAPRGPEWNRSRLAHALVDGSLFLALVGLALAAWRRFRSRRDGRRELPARAEDVALWALLLVAVLAALLMSALLVTLAKPAWRQAAILSNAIAGLLAPLSTPLRRSLYGVAWTTLHVALLGMAFLFPWTKWRHILLAPLSLLTRKREPLARLDPIDLEGEGPYGALRPRDLTWKERLDLAACTHCDRCTQACPAARGGGALAPRALIQTLAEAGGAVPLATACGEASLWECTTCLACDEACPVGISPLSLVVDLRRERVLNAAAFPAPLRDLFDHLRRRGNPWGLPRAERDAWLADLDLPVLAPGERAEVLLWLGCQGGYDARARDAVRALVALLRTAGIAPAILGPDEGCCGDAARRAGNEALWRELALGNVEALAACEAGTIVTLCPHCANTLGNEYAALGARLNVVHAIPFLAGLWRDGRLPCGEACGEIGQRDITEEMPLRVAFHDPCYLARGLGDVSSARALLTALPGVQTHELSAQGADTLCCGAGGGRMWLEGSDKLSLGAARVEEIVAAGAELCVTACPYCRTMLADGLADRGAGTTVCDLTELLAHALHIDASPILPLPRREE